MSEYVEYFTNFLVHSALWNLDGCLKGTESSTRGDIRPGRSDEAAMRSKKPVKKANIKEGASLGI